MGSAVSAIEIWDFLFSPSPFSIFLITTRARHAKVLSADVRFCFCVWVFFVLFLNTRERKVFSPNESS